MYNTNIETRAFGVIQMKIALCDDNYIQVKFIEDYLRAKKMDVDYYDSGEALVRAYRDGGQRYDAVFLDI